MFYFQRKVFLLSFVLILNICWVRAQQPSFTSLDLPGKEVYKLLIDKKGFLWIANDFGVSRYDGIQFIHFSNPQQNSLAATGLLEDEQGRIWFTNFTGQIFYIENDIMNLLSSYNNVQEASFSRIALCGNLLVATSSKGLFVVNTATLAGKYVSSSNSKTTRITSITVIRDKVIGYGEGKWYLYKANCLLKNVPLYGWRNNHLKNDFSTLNAEAKRDTALLISNPSNTLSKIIIRHDSIILVKQLNFTSFINTVSIGQGNNWINTKSASYSMDNRSIIRGLNLTDIVRDHEGNLWQSSLTNGVRVNYGKKAITIPDELPFLRNDVITSLNHVSDKLLLGTQNGRLILYDTKLSKVSKDITPPFSVGTVSNITALDAEHFIIACSTDAFLLNVKSAVFKKLPKIKALKQTVNLNDGLYMASSEGLFIYPSKDTEAFRKQISAKYHGVFNYNVSEKLYELRKRCKSVCYDPATGSLIAAFMDGVYRIDGHGLTQLLFNNEKLFSPTLMQIDGKIFIGTINKGLLILKNGKLTQKGIADGLLSTSILKIKLINNQLWLFGTSALQRYDLKSEKILNIDLPPKSYLQITDISNLGDELYLAARNSLIKLPSNLPSALSLPPDSYLLSVKINNVKMPLRHTHNFNYRQNNIEFEVGVPMYQHAAALSIRYKLSNGQQSQWQVTGPGERTIAFSLLEPGQYNFVAFAVDPGNGEAKIKVSYSFTIRAPWWQKWWFILFFIF